MHGPVALVGGKKLKIYLHALSEMFDKWLDGYQNREHGVTKDNALNRYTSSIKLTTRRLQLLGGSGVSLLMGSLPGNSAGEPKARKC